MSEQWGVSIDLELDGDLLTMKGCRRTRSASDMKVYARDPIRINLKNLSEDIKADLEQALFFPDTVPKS